MSSRVRIVLEYLAAINHRAMEQYPVWLAANGVLPGAEGRQDAFTNDYLPRS